MNKIYKVVWNNTLQCYTVVSELAKSHTKNNASKVIKATVLSSILAVTSSTYAAQVVEGSTVQTTDSQNPQFVTINVDQDTTVDSISVGNDAVTKIYVLGKDVKFTVNKDISLNTPSSAGLYFNPSTSSDGNGNITFDKSSSLHVKGNINITNTNTQTELDVSSGYPGIFLGLSPNTTVDGTVNVKSDALHTIKASDTNGNEVESQYPGASLSLSGNSTIEKDLNVDKSHVSASFTSKIDDKTISPQDENERIQINGNASFTDNSSLDVMAKMGVKGDLSFEKSRLYLALNSLFASPMWNLKTAADNIALDVDGNASFTNGSSLDVLGRLKVKGDLSLENSPLYLSTYYSILYDGKEERVQPVDEASMDVGGNLKISGVTDDGSTIYNTVAGDAILNVAGNVDISGSNSLEIRENSTATIGGDLNLNHVEDTNVWNKVYNGSSMTVNGDLNMKGHYREGYYTEETDQEFFRNDFFVSGQDDSGEVVGKGGYLNIKGNVKLTDNSHFFTESYSNTMDQSNPNHNKYFPKDSFEKLTTSLIEGNITLDRNSRLGSYNAGESTVNGNVTATNGASVEAWNSDAYLNIEGDTLVTDKNSQIGLGRTGDIDIGGKLSVKNGANVYIEDDSTLSVAKSLTLENSLIEGYKAKLNVGGDLTITNNTDESIWNKLDRNSELTVNGDLNMKGQYKEGVYDENNEDGYFKNNLFISGAGNNVGSTALIKGDVHLSDNSHFFTETYSQPAPDHETYHSRDEFKQLSSTTIEGNVTIDSNSRLGTYSASDTLVKGNVDITSGASMEAWNSDAHLGINGDVLVTDENSQVGVGRTADIDIDGKLTAKNGADVYIGEESTLSVAKKFLVDNATLEIHGGQLLLSGEDSVLDLTNNGVLKTDEAGSIELEKGASVNSKTKTLLSDDTTTTADGVAEKTFEADALSKVSLVDFNKEVSLDEAKRLHSVLFNSDTGILDLKIASDKPSDEPSKPDSGNASFDDAINAGGTTAVEDKTIADVDTSDKKLSDLTSSDLSWGSASLKEGQTDLDLGSGNLVLNNPESNNGSFVSTADGTTGNITMDKDANLALNGNGSIGDITTTENGTGDILIGNDKSGSVNANNLGSEDKAFGSVSVGAGSSVTVKNILNATKVALEKKAEVIASVINSPELKAIGDDIKIKAENSVLGGLLSGNNSTLESKTLELADNFNVLGGAKVKAKNLSLKGKMLFADPDWNSNASSVVANNLSGTDGNVLDGALVAGQNSLVAVSDTLDENSAAVLAKSTLSENGTTALGYVGKDITVAANGSITIDGSLTSAPATVEDNTVTVANKSDLVLDNNSKVSFESADGKVTNNGTIVVSSDTLANNSKITAFSGENVSVSGNGSFDVSSALFSANSNGDGTVTVNYDENKANSALYGTEANVAQSIKTAVSSGVAVNKGTILGDLVNAGNSSTTASTLSQLTRLGTLAGSVANAKLASDTTANAIDSRLGSSGVKTNTQATAQSNKLTVWVQPVFSRQSSSSLDAGNTEYGIKTNLRGGVAGLDVTLSDNFVQGAAITVGSGNSSSKNIKSVSGDFDYYGFNLYGAYVNDALKLSYDLGYTKVSNDATAYNSLGKFTSDIDTKVFTFGIKGAYTFNTSVMDITPHLGVRYAKYDSDDYTATSGLYSVNNEGASSSLVSFPVGVSFSKDISLSSWTVAPTVNLEVIPVTGDKDVDTKSAFDGVVTSVNTKLHDGINYSTFVGLDALYGENFSLGINYNYTGSKNVDDHSVNASLRYTF